MGRLDVFKNTLRDYDINGRIVATGITTFSIVAEGLDADLKKVELSMAEFIVLMHLRNVGEEINLKEVKERVIIYSGASITKIADRLLQKGFITRRENPQSRREKLIRATPSGLKNCEKGVEVLKSFSDKLFSGLNQSAKKTVLGNLSNLLVNYLSLTEE